jgi:hypothetical protein
VGLVEPHGKDFHLGVRSTANGGSTGPTRRSHMTALNPVEFHRFHQSRWKDDPGSNADEIANHGDGSFGPVPAASSSIFWSST